MASNIKRNFGRMLGGERGLEVSPGDKQRQGRSGGWSGMVRPLQDACPQPFSDSLRLCLKFPFQGNLAFLGHVTAVSFFEEEGTAPNYRPTRLGLKWQFLSVISK